MELQGMVLPSIAKCFLIFFGASCLLLGIILCAGAPAALRAVKKQLAYALARRTRSDRMLADKAQLMRDAHALEGVYRFEPAEVTSEER